MQYYHPKHAPKYLDFLIRCFVVALMFYGAFTLYETVSSFNQRLLDVEATNIELSQHIRDLDNDINHVPGDEN